MTSFTIGADPELFAQKNDIPISLIDKIGGTKQNPIQVFPGYGLQEDNVAAEFNIPPCSTEDTFVQAINLMVEHIQKKLKELNLDISTKASYSFSDEELCTPEAWIFGCDPDFNAWEKSINPKPHSDNKYLRTAGGHIHIGTKINPILGTKAMDFFLGIPSVIFDTNKERRSLYGKAGAFRVAKKFTGFEYRVLSNFWIFNNYYIRWVYRSVTNALKFAETKEATRFLNKHKKNIINIINNSDIDLAKEYMIKYSHLYYV